VRAAARIVLLFGGIPRNSLDQLGYYRPIGFWWIVATRQLPNV